MAVTALGLLGTGSSSTAGTTLPVVNTTGAVIPAGTLIHISNTLDNTNATSPGLTLSTVGGVAPTSSHSVFGSGTSATAGSGVWHACWRVVTTASIASGGTITTITSTQSNVKRVAVATGYSGCTATLRGTVATGTSTTGSATATNSGTAPVAGDLVIGTVSSENNAQVTGDADTTNGSWTSVVGVFTTGGGAATNVNVGTQAKIVTAGGAQTYNPTGGVADTALCTFALVPVPDPLVTQAAYRFYADGTETGSTALGTQDTAYGADVSSGDLNLGVRVRVQETAGGPLPATTDWKLQWEKNASGTWVDAGASSNPPLIDEYASSNFDTGTAHTGSPPQREAQSFLGTGTAVVRAGFWLRKDSSPNGTVTAELYAHSGTYGASGSVPTGAALATSTTVINATDLPTTAGWVYFDFSGAPTLTNGTPYYVAVSMTNNAGAPNYVVVGHDDSSPSHGGRNASYSLGTWDSSIARDTVFRVYSAGVGDTVVPYASANLTDGGATTNRLGAGSGSFVAGEVSETGTVVDLGWTASNYTELLYSVTLEQADLADSDTLRFRVLRNNVITGFTYTQVPTINVTKTAGPALPPRNIRSYQNPALSRSHNR